AIAARLIGKHMPLYATDYLRTALLDDKHAQVRRAAAEALGELDDALSVRSLTLALKDRSKLVRRAAVQSLRTLEATESVPDLVGVLLGDADSYVRWEAARTLEALNETSAIPALIEALTADSNSYVRYAAATALGEIGDEGVIDPLATAMLRDDNSYVRYAAARALGYFLQDSVDPSLVRTLMLGLDDSDKEVWHVVAENLWTSGEIVMPIVLGTLQSNNRRMRKVALKALLWLSAEYDDTELIGMMDEDIHSSWGWWN
ncbi:MAG: HEAT repeat domain-containing protein, partial [Chloroflexota bacterium]